MLEVITDNLDIWTTAQKQKKAVGRGRAKKDEGYGIKKLRELILELAVRGKLVPQDNNDEPASVLLARILKEREQSVKEKKIRKTKPLPLCTILDSDAPYNLPEKWEWVRLQQIIQISSGDGLTARNMNKDGGIPVYGGNGITGYHDLFNVDKVTLVIGRVGFYCGSIHLTPSKAWVTDNAFETTFSEDNIYIHFLSWLLKTTNLKENESATAQPVISGRKIYPIVVGLPPLAEQHRIVAKVDELMALCDQLEQEQADHQATHQTLVETLLNGLIESATHSHTSLRLSTSAQGEQNNAKHPEPVVRQAHHERNNSDHPELVEGYFNQLIAEHFDTLFITEQSIEKLKQTILQLAVMGKLVPQDPNDEPASVLLEKIAKEKAKLIEEGKIKKQKALPEIGEDEKPFELPNGWEWIRLGFLFNSIMSGGTPSKREPTYWGGNIPWASVKDLGKKRFIADTQDHITKEGLAKGSKLAQKGNILICTRMGLGKISIVKSPMAFNQDLKAVQLTSCTVVEFFLNTYTTLKIKGTGTTVAGIKQEQLLNYVIGLPPLKEQHHIAAKVDEIMALCDSLKVNLNQAQTTQTQLADAIVKQAVN